MALTLADRGEKSHSKNPIFTLLLKVFFYINLCNYRPSVHLQEDSSDIGLYLSFYLSRVLGPFVYERLKNLKPSEDTFGHDITSEILLRILEI